MTFRIEPTGEKNHTSGCCNQASRAFVHGPESTVATYFAHWPLGKLTTDHPGNLDLVIGRFDEASSTSDRRAVSLLYAANDGGQFMVTDAETRRDKIGTLTDYLLPRHAVIGTPLAQSAFDLTDAIMLQDTRVFKDGPFALFA